jgi:hypothetical protein
MAKYEQKDAFDVIREIKLHMQMCTRAWIGLGEGKVLILKDEYKGLSTYCIYEEGSLIFYDQKGGSQTILIEEITEIAGF